MITEAQISAISKFNIWDTEEYKLAPQSKKDWAFTHKNNYISPIEAAKKQGVKVSNREVYVKANTGEQIKIIAHAKFYEILPSESYRTYKIVEPESKQYQKIYLVKGSHYRNKNAVYFTQENFEKSKDVLEFKKEIEDAFKKFKEEHIEELKKVLKISQPELIKKAQKELVSLIKKNLGDEEELILDWFKKHDFSIPKHIRNEDFKNFIKEVNKTGIVPTRFQVSSSHDGYGHIRGTSIEIDYNNKIIKKYDWSTDD